MVTKLLREGGGGLLLLVNSFVLLNSVIGWVASQEQEEGRTSVQRKEEVQVLWGTLKGDLLTKGRQPGTLCSRSAPEAPWPRPVPEQSCFTFYHENLNHVIKIYNSTTKLHLYILLLASLLLYLYLQWAFQKLLFWSKSKGSLEEKTKIFLLGFFSCCGLFCTVHNGLMKCTPPGSSWDKDHPALYQVKRDRVSPRSLAPFLNLSL